MVGSAFELFSSGRKPPSTKPCYHDAMNDIYRCRCSSTPAAGDPKSPVCGILAPNSQLLSFRLNFWPINFFCHVRLPIVLLENISAKVPSFSIRGIRAIRGQNCVKKSFPHNFITICGENFISSHFSHNFENDTTHLRRSRRREAWLGSLDVRKNKSCALPRYAAFFRQLNYGDR